MTAKLRRVLAAGLGTFTAAALAACGGPAEEGDASGDGKRSGTVTLVAHDSFHVSEKVLKKFTETTGRRVEVLRAGDAGSALNQAVLSKDNPQGDVFFGVDNTLLSRALEHGLFAPYEAEGLEKVPRSLRPRTGEDRVTPVDTGDICVNYDRAYFEREGLEPPQDLGDLVKPEYRGLLVTENAATSSPGLGFLLATVAEYGDGWQEYWKKLRANGVEVVDGWEQAYNDRFSGSAGGRGKGDRPLVVSYASSPPAEVHYARSRPKEAPTGVATGTCFRQVEYAGLLAGADDPEGGEALLDFMLSKEFQRDVPLSMFVRPAREDVALPEVFTEYGARVEDPYTLDPDRIAENRESWVEAWTSLVVR